MKTIKITEKTISESIKVFDTELETIIKNTNADTLISNGNISTVIQQNINYKLKKDPDSIGKTIYSMGEIYNLKLMVDAKQLWTDNKIYLKKDDVVVEEVLVIDDNGMVI